MSSMAGQAGLVQSLLEIATNQDVSSVKLTLLQATKGTKVKVQAALYLKNLVNNAWNTSTSQTPSFTEKENISPSHNHFAQALSAQDREFLRVNIVQALDCVIHLSEHPDTKVIVSSIENIIYNIAQCDFEEWSKQCLLANIQQRLQSNTEQGLVSGLRTLKSVL